MNRGRERGEIVIGYRLASQDQDRAIINPPEKSVPRKWSLDDVFEAALIVTNGNLKLATQLLTRRRSL
ncbi:hypothetical protein K1719_021658 [Acacia pycnantha]|nr:hypothetical protein K1719_021658 [Acacia pycnantha]